MSYKYEFPDYDDELPVIDGFKDESWHNDVCPSLDYPLGGENILRIWFDYANPEMRECGGDQFALGIGEYSQLQGLMGSNDLNEILAYIKKHNLTKEQA